MQGRRQRRGRVETRKTIQHLAGSAVKVWNLAGIHRHLCCPLDEGWTWLVAELGGVKGLHGLRHVGPGSLVQ